MTLPQLLELARKRGVPDDAQIDYIDLNYPARGFDEDVRVETYIASQGNPNEHTRVKIWS